MKRYGFNFQWMFSMDYQEKSEKPDLKALDFMQSCGLDFARIPCDYRFWTKGFNYEKIKRKTLELIELYIEECAKRNIHLSLNMHRVPGYCINRTEIEKHNLWTDREARDAFIYQWQYFADYFSTFDSENISFDLMNEPPNVCQYGMTRKYHESLIRDAVKAIRQIDPERKIVIDGLGGGHYAMPELADLDVVQSGRGYQPMIISHYQTPWCDDTKDLPFADYPGAEFGGKKWDIKELRNFFGEWKQLEKKGVAVHIGEFGCYNKTPNETALRWFTDLFTIFRENGWGYAMWNFEGPFGIIGHGRPGAEYTRIDGYDVDKKLFELFLGARG
ncbi:MAG: cellulase family glycosylhydrolase [Spirochaetales bacterium]|nr:cellulase family glycosylhydrolase [Spirochaetales bacterium]